MDILEKKLGPLVFQFPFFNRSAFRDRHQFLDRLILFLRKLPAITSSRLRFEIDLGSMLNLLTCCAITESPSRSKIAPLCRAHWN
jgi:uncharacterized protein YecE (DUF72 family)